MHIFAAERKNSSKIFMETADIKQRFGIVGNDAMLEQAITTAVQIAPIQLSVLVIGESGSGKEAFPQIIHAYSQRKHRPYVAVNCGAIPEGTMDSELFGHMKGAFTGALSDRKGYFEEADTGTIFLDEIAELPLSTQAKLLRVLEKGEYMRVGSSTVSKTDVRIVAATNVDLERAIAEGRFREDLFYRLNGVMIRVPPLRNRKGDIAALFHKFTNDFADKNKMPAVRLTAEAADLLQNYDWPGNVRQLKNIAEQVTVLAPSRNVTVEDLMHFMPSPSHENQSQNLLPQIDGSHRQALNSERELLYKVLFDMRSDINDLKKLVMELLNNNQNDISQENAQIIKRLYQSNSGKLIASQSYSDGQQTEEFSIMQDAKPTTVVPTVSKVSEFQNAEYQEPLEEPFYSIPDNEKELIRKALEKHGGKRKMAAKELGISERTLYRKIHDYGITI